MLNSNPRMIHIQNYSSIRQMREFILYVQISTDMFAGSGRLYKVKENTCITPITHPI